MSLLFAFIVLVVIPSGNGEDSIPWRTNDPALSLDEIIFLGFLFFVLGRLMRLVEVGLIQLIFY